MGVGSVPLLPRRGGGRRGRTDSGESGNGGWSWTSETGLPVPDRGPRGPALERNVSELGVDFEYDPQTPLAEVRLGKDEDELSVVPPEDPASVLTVAGGVEGTVPVLRLVVSWGGVGDGRRGGEGTVGFEGVMGQRPRSLGSQ